MSAAQFVAARLKCDAIACALLQGFANQAWNRQ